jgi:Bacteriophage HK97-gp10, putative tail-component
LNEALLALPEEVRKEILTAAVDAAAEIVKAEAVRLAPRASGKLADSITVRRGSELGRQQSSTGRVFTTYAYGIELAEAGCPMHFISKSHGTWFGRFHQEALCQVFTRISVSIRPPSLTGQEGRIEHRKRVKTGTFLAQRVCDERC